MRGKNSCSPAWRKRMEFEDLLMLEKKLVLSDGAITIMNTRWAMLPEKFLSVIPDNKHPKELYEAGKEGGCEMASQIRKSQGLDCGQTADFFMRALSEFGWGNMHAESIEAEKKQAIVRPERTGNPLLCGIISGIFKAAFREDVDARESEGRIVVKKWDSQANSS